MILLMITWIVFALIGLALAGGGSHLVALGGSPYYVIAGLGFLLTAVLLAMRRPLALVVYGLVILLSLGWAVWEIGFDWWQLGPRGGVIVLLGVWLLLPRGRRGLGPEQPAARQRR